MVTNKLVAFVPHPTLGSQSRLGLVARSPGRLPLLFSPFLCCDHEICRSPQMLSSCYHPHRSPWFSSLCPINIVQHVPFGYKCRTLPLVVCPFCSLLFLTPCWNRGLLRFTRTWQIVSRRATVGVPLSVILGPPFWTATHSFHHPRLVAYTVLYVVYLFSTLFGFLISEMETRLLVDVLPGALVASVCCIT